MLAKKHGTVDEDAPDRGSHVTFTYISSRCHCHWRKPRIRLTRCRRMSVAVDRARRAAGEMIADRIFLGEIVDLESRLETNELGQVVLRLTYAELFVGTGSG